MRRQLLLVALVTLPLAAGAQTFPAVGAPSLGMAGAYTGVARGPTAAWWNPAGLALSAPGGSLVYGEAPLDPQDLAAQLADLAPTRATDDDIVDRPADATRALGLLGAIASEPDAISVTQPTGGFYNHRNFALSVYRMTLADATPLIDQSRTDLTAEGETSITANTSSLLVRSLETRDYALSISGQLGDPRILFGATARYHQGTTRLATTSLFGLNDFAASDVLDLDNDATEIESDRFSFDVGTLITFDPRFRLGVVGKYIGGPGFDTGSATQLELEPRWRAGFGYFPVSSVILAADLDLSRTTPLGGSEGSRELSVGAEVALLEQKLRLRGGFRTAIQGPTARLVTGGIGLLAGSLALDGAVGYAPDGGSTSFMLELGFLGRER